MSETIVLDSTGQRRSPAVMPGYRAGCAPANKGMRYPPDPPRAEEIIAVMREAGEGRHALRMSGLIVVLCRAGLRISEALALTETDLDAAVGSVLVRRGKGERRRVVGMDAWGWSHYSASLVMPTSARKSWQIGMIGALRSA